MHTVIYNHDLNDRNSPDYIIITNLQFSIWCL